MAAQIHTTTIFIIITKLKDVGETLFHGGFKSFCAGYNAFVLVTNPVSLVTN